MQNYISILLLIFLFGCNKQPSESDLLNKKDPKGKYGEPVSEISPLSFSELLTSPNNFLNKNVLVEGVIKEVCPMRGCWVQISDMDKITKESTKEIEEWIRMTDKLMKEWENTATRLRQCEKTIQDISNLAESNRWNV